MTSSKIIGAILIIISLALGYMGYAKINQATKAVDVLGIELKAADKSEKETGYIYVGLAVVLFLGGAVTLNKSK